MGVGTLGYLLPYPPDMQAEGWIATAPPASGPTTAVTPLSQNYATTANLGLAAGMHNFTECYIILALLQTLSALSTSQCLPVNSDWLWIQQNRASPISSTFLFWQGHTEKSELEKRRNLNDHIGAKQPEL